MSAFIAIFMAVFLLGFFSGYLFNKDVEQTHAGVISND